MDPHKPKAFISQFSPIFMIIIAKIICYRNKMQFWLYLTFQQ